MALSLRGAGLSLRRDPCRLLRQSDMHDSFERSGLEIGGTHTANLITKKLVKDDVQDNGNNVHVNVDAVQLSLDFVEVGLVKARRAA